MFHVRISGIVLMKALSFEIKLPATGCVGPHNRKQPQVVR